MSKRAYVQFRIRLDDRFAPEHAMALTLDTEAIDTLVQRSRGRGSNDWYATRTYCYVALEQALVEWARKQFPDADSDVDALSIGLMNVQNLRRKEGREE